MDDLECHTRGGSPYVAHAEVNHIECLKILWGNCRGGNILECIQLFISLHDMSKYTVSVVLWRHFKEHSSL